MSSSIQKTINFIREIYGTNEFIPLHEPKFWGNEKKYVIDTIDSTFVSSVGAYVDRFEEIIAEISHAKRAVATVNGTAALQVALQLAGVSQGDEVITQSLSFVATANSIKYNGAHPVFLDVDKETMGLSPNAVEVFLEECGEVKEGICFNKKNNRRIAACVPMHTFGFPVHLKDLTAVCEKWHIPLVEDAAESVGSQYHGRPTGSFGKFGVFSFNGNKIVTAGGGGAIITNSKKDGDFAKHLTTTAKKPHKYKYIHDEIGYNYRMPNLNAALICAQLEQLDLFIEVKRHLANSYAHFFKDTGIKFRIERPNTKANYWLMCVEFKNRKERDEFLEETNSKGVMTRPIWELLYHLPMYKDCYRDSQENAKYLADRIVNIPSSAINHQ